METKSVSDPELTEAPSVIAKQPKSWPNAPDPNFFAATSGCKATFLKQNPGEAPLPTDGEEVSRAMDNQIGLSTPTPLRQVLRPFLTLAAEGALMTFSSMFIFITYL